MSVVQKTLQQAFRNWEARKLMTAHNAINHRRQVERVWPHPLTHEQRQKFQQGVYGLRNGI